MSDDEGIFGLEIKKIKNKNVSFSFVPLTSA
jgi:hypothetical protein